MNKKLKAIIRKMLLAQKKECEKELTQLNGRFTPSEEIITSYPASSYVSDDITSTLFAVKKKMIAKYNEALERLKDGEYGICAECEEPIPLGRLKPVPFADKCAPCKDEAEEKDMVYINGTKHRVSKLVKNFRPYNHA